MWPLWTESGDHFSKRVLAGSARFLNIPAPSPNFAEAFRVQNLTLRASKQQRLQEWIVVKFFLHEASRHFGKYLPRDRSIQMFQTMVPEKTRHRSLISLYWDRFLKLSAQARYFSRRSSVQPSVIVNVVDGKAILRLNLGFFFHGHIRAPTKVLIYDPCPFGLPEILTGVQLSRSAMKPASLTWFHIISAEDFWI